jgi:hypothetical protein
MSAAQIVLRAAGSGGWDAAVIRWAWLAVAWVRSWTASRALPEGRAASAWARTAAAVAVASGVRVNPASAARVVRTAVSWAGV